jgi:hypothetical protein
MVLCGRGVGERVKAKRIMAGKGGLSRGKIAGFVLVALILIGVWLGTGFGISTWLKEDKEEDHHQCCEVLDHGRRHAEEIASKMFLAMSQVPIDPEEGAEFFASFFERHRGVYSTVAGNSQGRHNIKQAVENWGLLGNNANLTIVPRRTYWDAKRATLTVEVRWHAVALDSRLFLNNFNTIVTYPPVTPYHQDDCVVIRFNCEHKVLYFRDYFDMVQRLSTYTRHYPSICPFCGPRERPHKFRPDTDAPTMEPTFSPTEPPTTETPTVAPTGAPTSIGK